MSFLELFIFSLLPSISNKNLRKLKKILVLKNYNKGETLTSKNSFYILKSGVVKGSQFDSENQKQNTKLYIPESKSSIINNIINVPETDISYKCLTNVELYSCHYTLLYDLISDEFEISIFFNRLLEHQAMLNERRIDDLMQLSTKKKYLKLLDEIPYLEKILPRYVIAEYLNITPAQLIRIRKKS